jgi:uncharacterized membrane protein
VIEALEASALAEHLRRSRWTYPLVNAGHVLGIALLVGAVVPMQVQRLRGGASLVPTLRPYAIAGLALAVACGILLFIAQAGDYLASPWFLAKMALLAVALAHAAWHLRATVVPRAAALVSLILWPLVLVAGRMIAYG